MGRKDWQPVLDAEIQRWSAKSWQQLVAEVAEVQHYEVEFNSRKYQVEVELLENTAQYVNVSVAVDDGTLPASILPLSRNFLSYKDNPDPEE